MKNICNYTIILCYQGFWAWLYISFIRVHIFHRCDQRAWLYKFFTQEKLFLYAVLPVKKRYLVSTELISLCGCTSTLQLFQRAKQHYYSTVRLITMPDSKVVEMSPNVDMTAS
jgi:hypothetical protein